MATQLHRYRNWFPRGCLFEAGYFKNGREQKVEILQRKTVLKLFDGEILVRLAYRAEDYRQIFNQCRNPAGGSRTPFIENGVHLAQLTKSQRRSGKLAERCWYSLLLEHSASLVAL